MIIFPFFCIKSFLDVREYILSYKVFNVIQLLEERESFRDLFFPGKFSWTAITKQSYRMSIVRNMVAISIIKNLYFNFILLDKLTVKKRRKIKKICLIFCWNLCLFRKHLPILKCPHPLIFPYRNFLFAMR